MFKCRGLLVVTWLGVKNKDKGLAYQYDFLNYELTACEKYFLLNVTNGTTGKGVEQGTSFLVFLPDPKCPSSSSLYPPLPVPFFLFRPCPSLYSSAYSPILLSEQTTQSNTKILWYLSQVSIFWGTISNTIMRFSLVSKSFEFYSAETVTYNVPSPCKTFCLTVSSLSYRLPCNARLFADVFHTNLYPCQT